MFYNGREVDAKDLIMEYVRQHEGCGTKDIVKATGMSPTKAGRVARSLAIFGYLKIVPVTTKEPGDRNHVHRYTYYPIESIK